MGNAAKLKNRPEVIQFYNSTRVHEEENQKERSPKKPLKSSVAKDKALLSKAIRHKKITVND